ncbi:VWA domain-containing protein [Acidicapsa dinghuensis]|uniref:VWA domain-containing protein n=1 Tax=Acidicapsa dinghuensis TaxID=2218256 RepID=A0ABW1EIB9_9BACT|nr:VWA domain-containing protein [Acidicapsa dinghuensis]
MRNKLAVLGLLALTASAACAEKRLTVQQLQETLRAAQLAHRPDAEVTRDLAAIAMTERISPATLTTLIADSTGEKSTEALRVLADGSTFLPLPASEIPTRPTPDFSAQKVIMGRVVNYVVHTIPLLPNLMATRTTEHFADIPDARAQQGEAVSGGFYKLGAMHTTIAYRDGRETDDPTAQAEGRRKPYVTTGLTSWGEFGSILSVVLLDAAKGKLGWDGWVTWNGKSAAVFRFSVDRAASHYTLQYHKSDPGELVNSHYASDTGGRSEGVSTGIVSDNNPLVVRETAGYHGSFTVDPETGVILEIKLQADPTPEDMLRRADIAVQYGSVVIGEKTYFCPIHSIAVSAALEPRQTSPISPIETVKELQLNDVTFTSYRRFGSETTLVLNDADQDKADQGKPDTSTAATVTEPASAESASESASSTSAPPLPNSSVAASPAPRPASAQPVEAQEMSVSTADSLPLSFTSDTTQAGATTPSTDSGFKLQVTTRLVNIGLIATDKHGKPVTDLKPDQIELYDNGRPQQIATFGHLQDDSSKPTASATPPTDTFTNTGSASPSLANSSDLLILMIDESHLPFLDINRARSEMLQFLKMAHPNTRLAIYSVNEHGFRVLQDVTTDHEFAETALAKWMPSAAGLSQAAEMDQRNRQQFDTVRNPEDLNMVNGNHIDVPDAMHSADPQLRQLGDNPLGLSLISMIALAQHFGSMQGHKTLVWISGDSALYDWRDQQPNIERTVSTLDAAIQHARDALNEAHISLYAVDASILDTGGAAVDPSLANAQVQLNPVASANSAPGGSNNRGVTPGGRVAEQMQVNTHDIQPSVRLLAESTGGRAINKGSDLEKTLDSIMQESVALYEISFRPDMPADNKFHTLQLKVKGRKDVRLRYRTGYMYGEEATTAKERFQEAVWRPQDLNGIQLSAEPVKAADAPGGKPTIRLRIALSGLGLKQEQQGADVARWTDKLYIFLAQRDDGVRKAQVSGDTLQLALKQATYDSGMPAGIPYQREVDSLSKLGSIRVVVIDANTGRIGSVTMPSSALQP